MFVTKFYVFVVLLTGVMTHVVANPIVFSDISADGNGVPLRDEMTLGLVEEEKSKEQLQSPEKPSPIQKESFVVEIRDMTTLTTVVTSTTSTTTKCTISLYRPTPYTQGSIKTVWASTRYLTSYQPCGECTLFAYNPFTYKIPIKWESTTTVSDTPRTKLVDKCEPTKVPKTSKTTTTRATTTTKAAPVYS